MIILALASLFLSAMTVVESTSLGEIMRALGSGNAVVLGQYFDSNVEITIMDDEQTYTKDRAIQVMKDFFARNPTKGFVQVHQGVSRQSQSEYIIGNLSTTNGVFRVYIYCRVAGANYFVQEIRIDRE
jgi:hypothetical protein